jgi:hypothetical protein
MKERLISGRLGMALWYLPRPMPVLVGKGRLGYNRWFGCRTACGCEIGRRDDGLVPQTGSVRRLYEMVRFARIQLNCQSRSTRGKGQRYDVVVVVVVAVVGLVEKREGREVVRERLEAKMEVTNNLMNICLAGT